MTYFSVDVNEYFWQDYSDQDYEDPQIFDNDLQLFFTYMYTAMAGT